MALLRRFLVICALGLWLGGLTFYSLVVIRHAHAVIHGHFKVGLVTQRVTSDLNLIGAAALALMAWNLIASWRTTGGRLRAWMSASCLVALVAHLVVYRIHHLLDRMLERGESGISGTAAFHSPHEAYLIATAFEWGAGLTYLLFAILGWKREDAASPGQK